jgi:hypothetical protein
LLRKGGKGRDFAGKIAACTGNAALVDAQDRYKRGGQFYWKSRSGDEHFDAEIGTQPVLRACATASPTERNHVRNAVQRGAVDGSGIFDDKRELSEPDAPAFYPACEQIGGTRNAVEG